jgi:hypothetical protein
MNRAHLIVALIVCLSPLWTHIFVTYYEYYADWTVRYAANAKLIFQPVCTEAWLRKMHGPNQDDACNRAYTENLVWPTIAAARQLFTHGELYRLWNNVAGSPWMLFGLGCCLIISCMYFFWNASSSPPPKKKKKLKQHNLLLEYAAAALLQNSSSSRPRIQVIEEEEQRIKF